MQHRFARCGRSFRPKGRGFNQQGIFDKFDKVKAFECGGVDYVSKPFYIEEVVARIENQLTIQRQKIALKQEIKERQETEEVLWLFLNAQPPR